MLKRIGDLRERVHIDRRALLTASGEFLRWADAEATWDATEATWDETAVTVAGDGAGNFRQGWARLLNNRAAGIAPRRGGEQVIAERLTGVDAYDIWLRLDAQSSDIRPSDRVVDARDPSRIYNVRFVGNLDARKRFVLLQCSLGDVEG